MYRLGVYRLAVKPDFTQALLFRRQCRLVCHAVFLMFKKKIRIVFEQTQGKETLFPDGRFYYGKKICYRFFKFVGIAQGNARLGVFRRLVNARRDGVNAYSFACACADCRNAEQALERGDIGYNAVCFRFVEQVHTEQNMRRYLRNLNQQIEISLQAGGVADYDDRLGISEADEITRGGFLLGICRQGIAPGQVDKRTARIAAVACGKPDGFARPVSRVLIQSRQIIENRAFAYIRIPCERDSPARNFRFIRYALSSRAACQSHFHPPSVKFCMRPAVAEQ